MKDGGYYAIKGFQYQFDTTLIDILSNKDKDYTLEHIQDFQNESTYTQVKHKEALKYSLYNVKKAIKSIFKDYKEVGSGKYVLKAYFKNKKAGESLKFSVAELKKVLEREKVSLLKDFAKSFEVIFTENYEENFQTLIDLIKEEFNLDQERAIICHAILQTHLEKVSINKIPKNRVVDFETLVDLYEDSEEVIFYPAYYAKLGRDAYIKQIRSRYFKRPYNLDGNHKIFIINPKDVSFTDSKKLLTILKKNYVRDGITKSPILYFPKGNINELKRDLIDNGTAFNDGTYFDGDKLRKEDLVDATKYNSNKTNPVFRIITLPEVFMYVLKELDCEVYDFYQEERNMSFFDDNDFKQIYVNSMQDIINLLE